MWSCMTDDCEIPMRRWRDLPSAPSKRAGPPRPFVELVNFELFKQTSTKLNESCGGIAGKWHWGQASTPSLRWLLPAAGPSSFPQAFCIGSPGDLSLGSAAQISVPDRLSMCQKFDCPCPPRWSGHSGIARSRSRRWCTQQGLPEVCPALAELGSQAERSKGWGLREGKWGPRWALHKRNGFCKPLFFSLGGRRRRFVHTHPRDFSRFVGLVTGPVEPDETSKERDNRRKFRSQTSDNMDRWKAEMGRVREEKRRRKKIKKEKVSEERKKIQVREKVGKSRNTVFFQWFVAPEGRK